MLYNIYPLKMSAPEESTQPSTPTHASSTDKHYKFDPNSLDDKYKKPQLMSNFKVFFGKYKDKTFKEVLADQDYCDFLLSLEDVKTNNMYLLIRYIKHEYNKPKEQTPKKKTKKA